jgi:glucose/arabinose dehydrogenase
VVATIDGKKQLVSSEHGPRGGDELNVIEKGADYGWPRTSYGTPYGPAQPANTADVQGKHVGKANPPLFAWVPSAGIGAMIQIKGRAFGQWWANTPGSADLFVAGMGARFIYRLRVQDGAVRYMEEAQFGARIRSLVQLPSGAIACGLDAGNDLLILQPTQVWNESKAVFQPPS